MRKIIIIGTIHGGFTPNKELQEVLEKLSPNKILVEITTSDIKNRKLKTYPPEMRFVYKWAKNNDIDVGGFDYEIDVLAKSMTEKDNKRAIKIQDKLLEGFTWKDMNKEKNLRIISPKSVMKMIDKKKWEKREIEMLKNIRKELLLRGKTVIVTGCGHLSFFEKHIRNAIFPFRT